MNQARLCLSCNEALQGRTDKKFCDDQCRSNYNNKIYSESNTYVKQVGAILKKNRKILAELNPTGKTKILKKKLVSKGYNFEYFTNLYQTQTGKTYCFVFEFGYLELANDEFLLVKREEN